MIASELTLDSGGAASLIERAISGDEVAFARIVVAHHEDMSRIAYLVSGSLDVAEEAVQAAWAIAWRRLSSLRDPSRLRPWLMSVAANEARQLGRRNRRRSVREVVVAEIGDPTGADRTALIDLANALASLDEKDRTLIGLRYIAGLDSAEIGREIGLSASGVRVRLHRLMARLRVELDDN
jgi:RNA polymerase sigma-70 factor (ECF subfamily)